MDRNSLQIPSVKRKKHIYMFDSWMSYFDVIFNKESRNISGRNPLKRDELAINYDLDSEDEWHELNGDDLEND
jgi:hypothetical protein